MKAFQGLPGFIGFMLIASCWLSCANIVSPTGGAKDEKPPLLKKRNLPDSSLNFKGGKVIFDFDEFLQLKDVENQLVITPLLAGRPKVSIHKKRLTINLPDTLLLPNTTYRITMGNAIQDLHEGNAVKSLAFTFSTGSYFDSLTLKGMVYEAESGRPDTTSWVVLYAWPMKDSAFNKLKPMYAQKTSRGVFRFESLPARPFAIFSLKETNNNLKYDAAGETISFYENSINPADSQLFITLYSFIEKGKPDTSASRLKSKLSTPAPVKGNMFVYMTNVDTTQKTKRIFDINDSIVISFLDSIAEIDPARIRLFQGNDFDATASISIDTSSKKIVVKTEWVQDAVYTLTLLKSFAQNKQQVQAAAGSFTFRTKKESDYGTLFISTEINEHKIISLYRDDKRISSQNATDTLLKFALLTPGNYQISILEDKNKNGVWDTGNLHDKQLPEIVKFLAEAITIKPNWTNRIDLKTKNPQSKPAMNK